ncbi:hypothetical protein HAX54_011318 [Datura stramonium]|uniref:Uncharacterized protein n=1 Tax=Datura stramonium TaxID=4076 RepID=A0ABS8TIK0_DATST|nr:hypothetical protein [Datura stramonium]
MKKAERAPTCWCQKSSMVTPREEPEKSITSCGRTVVSKRNDGVATRLISGVAAAFFVSLERCSCVYVDTKHDSEDAGETCALMITEVGCDATDENAPRLIRGLNFEF